MHENNPSVPEINIAQPFELVDQAYIDNIILSFIIKYKSPEAYEQCIGIIDKYVRPRKNTEGLTHLYKECSGFLVYLLNEHCGTSIRSSSYLASKIYKISESIPETRYRKILSQTEHETDLSSLINPFTHLLIFGSSAHLATDVDAIKPRMKHTRSENELMTAINSYKDLKKSIFNLYIADIQPLCNHETPTILDQMDTEEFDLSFLYEGHYPETPSDLQLAVLCGMSLCMRQMPNVMYYPLAFIQQENTHNETQE